MTEGIERRNSLTESRRACDCFPSGGAMVIAIGIASLLAFAFGLALGKWVM